MSSKLFGQLKGIEKKVKKKVKKNINPNSPFGILSDKEIGLVLAYRARELRLSKRIKQKEFSQNAGLSSSSTYSNFEQKGTVSLLNFIKIIKSFGRLDELENLLKPKLSEKIEKIEKSMSKRIR